MEESISDKLVIAATGAVELPADILEFAIDQALDEGILKDIPFIGWIAKGLSVQRSISDRIFFQKILRFLHGLEGAADSNRDVFRLQIEQDPVLGRRVGEHLVVLLDKLDALDKPGLLAKCFTHVLTGKLDPNRFFDLAHIIERSTIADLKALGVPANEPIKFVSTGVAVACGIMEFGIVAPETEGELPQLGTRMSRYGRDLRDIFLERFKERVEQENEGVARLNELFGAK